jgi:hypothetical protein
MRPETIKRSSGQYSLKSAPPIPPVPGSSQGFVARVPAQPIDEQCRQVAQIIDLAFDTLGAHYLEVFVSAAPIDAHEPLKHLLV